MDSYDNCYMINSNIIKLKIFYVCLTPSISGNKANLESYDSGRQWIEILKETKGYNIITMNNETLVIYVKKTNVHKADI